MQVWQYRLAAVLSRRLPRRCGYWCGLRIADYYYYRRTTERHAVLEKEIAAAPWQWFLFEDFWK
jgi:hypothetical protein